MEIQTLELNWSKGKLGIRQTADILKGVSNRLRPSSSVLCKNRHECLFLKSCIHASALMRLYMHS